MLAPSQVDSSTPADAARRALILVVERKGAKFTIELPTSSKMEESQDLPPQMEREMLSRTRILVVDDSDDTVDMLRRLFALEGAVVAAASSGAEALAIAREKDFDVVLSDISMPGMDGFEFVRRLRQMEKQKGVPVLALTGFGRAEDLERAQAEGFLAHVTKPVDVASLIEIIRKLPVKSGQLVAGQSPDG